MSEHKHKTVTFTFRYRWQSFIFLFLVILPIMGCDLNAENEIQALNFSKNFPSDPSGILHLYFSPLPTTHPFVSNSYGIEIKDAETGRFITRDWIVPSVIHRNELDPQVLSELLINLNENQETILRVSTPSLPIHAYDITIFIEGQANPMEGGVPRYSPCPSPPSLLDPFKLNDVDPFRAIWQGMISKEVKHQWVAMKQISCGLGDLNTQLIGQLITLPERVDQIHLNVSYQDEESSEFPSLVFPLKNFIYPLNPTQEELMLSGLILTAEEQLYQFMIPQLRPGQVSIQIFTDQDQDHNLTPCDLQTLTGADRFLSERRELLLEKGNTHLLEQPLSLVNVSACDQVSDQRMPVRESKWIAMTGQLEMNDEFLQALQMYRKQKALWYQRDQSPARPLADLYQMLRAQGRFTLLVPIDELNHSSTLSLWIDQGNDGRFEPCELDGASGVDVRWWTGQIDRLLTLEEGFSNTKIPLLSTCDAPDALVSGRIEIELDPPDQWAPRNLILEREDLFSGERNYQTISRLKKENLSTSQFLFEQRVDAGSYAYRAYIEQGDAPGFQPCEPGRLGEIFATNSEELVSVNYGEHPDPITLRLSPLPCINPTATLQINPIQPSLERVIGGMCTAQEIYLSVSSEGEELISPKCAPLDAQGAVHIEDLYAGAYQITLCQQISPSPIVGLPCTLAQALLIQTEVVMTQSPVQDQDLVFDYACACPNLIE